MFDGQIWCGQRAVEAGLIDGLDDVRTKMRAVYGEKVKLKIMGRKKGFLGLRLGQSAPDPLQQILRASCGDSLTDDAISTLDARALWARYGF